MEQVAEFDHQADRHRGLADLDIILDHTPYLDASMAVSAANGNYVEEESLLGSGPNERHVVVLVDQNDRATIRLNVATSVFSLVRASVMTRSHTMSAMPIGF